MAKKTQLHRTCTSTEKFWSVLPPIPLKGVGTSLVESLDHYLQRVARVMGVNVARLIALISANPKARYDYNRTRIGICGPGYAFRVRISNLDELSGAPDLRSGTLWVLDKLLCCHAFGREFNYRRWCPECLRNWNSDTSWEPLIWSFSVQRRCPVHKSLIEDACRHCGSRQEIRTNTYSSRTCAHCQKPLSGHGRDMPCSHVYDWAEYQLEKLITLCATPGQPQVAHDTYKIFIDELKSFNPYLRNPHTLESSIPISAFVHQQFGSAVTITGLIGTCALTAVSAVDLLLRPKEAASKQLINPPRRYEPLPLADENVAPLWVYLSDLKRGPFRRYEIKESSSNLYRPSKACLEKIICDANGLLNRDRQESRSDHRATAALKSKQRSICRSARARRDDKVFEIAYRVHVCQGLNPFASLNHRGAIETVCNEADVDEDVAIWFLKSAALLRQSIERVKARVLGLGHWELKDYAVFGGIISGVVC